MDGLFGKLITDVEGGVQAPECSEKVAELDMAVQVREEELRFNSGKE